MTIYPEAGHDAWTEMYDNLKLYEWLLAQQRNQKEQASHVPGKSSAGLLMYRRRDGQIEVLLARPGGPFFRNKDDGVWSITKGEIEPGEKLLPAAKREFEEETGIQPTGPITNLEPVTQKGGKTVHAWAFEGDCDVGAIRSNTFTMEWPPKTGQQMEFPEIARAAFFDLATARERINSAQVSFIDQLEEILDSA